MLKITITPHAREMLNAILSEKLPKNLILYIYV
jgi:hypothetical protein